jgi:phosphate transport system permease protein
MTTTGQTAPRTTLPPRPQPRPQQPRRLAGIRTPDVLSLVGALAAAFCTTGLLWTQIAPFSGIVGYVVVTWCLFVFIYAVLVSFDQDRPAVRDRVVSVVVQSLGALVALALIYVIIYTFARGYKALIHLNFYTQDLSSTGSLAPITHGGVIHAIVGTLIEVGIAMGIAVPLGLLTAVFMHEVPGTLSRLVRTVVDAMTALPDVLAGLFIYATLIIWLHRGFFGFAAACALAVTAVPIVARAAYVVLRLTPGGLTEASYALGSGQWRTVWHVTLPTARSGLATAVILGTARAIGETAPVLLTAGVNTYLNFNPFSGSMMSLPLLAYLSVSSPEPAEIERGFGAASILLVLVLLLFAAARAIGGRGPGQLTAGQQRRRALASRRDLARYERVGAMRAAGPAEYEYEYQEEQA